jgi:hypothetical protein
MIPLTIILVVLAAVPAVGQTPSRVPADTKENRLMVTVENASTWSDAESLQVRILRSPRGVTFNPLEVRAGRVEHGRSADIALVFDVDRDVPLDRPDTVVLGIAAGGEPLWQKSLVWLFTGPARYNLEQNFPNPFNPVTTIRFALPEQAQVMLSVFDVLGREIRTLIDAPLDRGYRSVEWDARTDAGLPAGTGVYFLRLHARRAARGGDVVQTRKILLLR